ncbi:hypothetical protein, partial [Mycobacterium pseudoshottsii]|uniref:hypothetical protein n=1 Tax=Mycobacterium pseudoshottsii TaxID=265949 RepID=UPI001F2A2CF4
TPAPIARHQRSSTQLTSLLINNAGTLGNGPFTRFPITGSRPFPVIGTGHDWVHFTGTRGILRENQRAQIVVAITDTIRRPTEVFGR